MQSEESWRANNNYLLQKFLFHYGESQIYRAIISFLLSLQISSSSVSLGKVKLKFALIVYTKDFEILFCAISHYPHVEASDLLCKFIGCLLWHLLKFLIVCLLNMYTIVFKVVVRIINSIILLHNCQQSWYTSRGLYLHMCIQCVTKLINCASSRTLFI